MVQCGSGVSVGFSDGVCDSTVWYSSGVRISLVRVKMAQCNDMVVDVCSYTCVVGEKD